MRYAISDIHGCAATFQRLLEKINFREADELYLLGDFIDRGPKSKEVIDTVLSLKANNYQVHCLMGNHEELLLDSFHNSKISKLWYHKNGGAATMDSFGARNLQDLDEKYLNFLNSLEYYFELEDFLLVHAGFDFSVKDFRSNEEAMLWIRNQAVTAEKTANRPVIHGHTPIPFSLVTEKIESRSLDLDIDNGCVYEYEGMNGLVAFNLDNYEITRQQNIESKIQVK